MASLVTTEPKGPVPFDESLVNQIRGKSLTLPPDIGREIRTLCFMLDWFESKLDETDEQNSLGTEGWRHYFGLSN